jgi:ribokinase
MSEDFRATVVVVGSVNIDHVVTASRFPEPGETILGIEASTGLGGKGANQAVAAALAGAPTTMIARVGADPEGALARDGMAQRGVDVSRVTEVEGASTGSAWITVAQGDNTIIVVSGANFSWPEGDPLSGAERNAGVVLSQLEVPLPVVHAAASAASKADALFVLNAAPASALPDELLALIDVLIVNEHELAVVARTEPDPPEQAHAVLRERGVRAVVTTLGPEGAIVTDFGGVTTRVPAVPAPEVIDTTGAGDAFTGVCAAKLATGTPLPEAARWGCVAGSLAVRAAGAQDSYPDAETLRREATLTTRTSQ